MKKSKVLLIILVVVLLLISYLALPIRPAIAEETANNYVNRYYSEYGLTTAEYIGPEYHSYYSLQWIDNYGFQSQKDELIAAIYVDGWFPFIVKESGLYELVGDNLVLLEQH